MKLRRLAALAFLLASAAQAFAADCHPDPLKGRVLYLRGTFNDWRADDETALRYVCDHYELVAKLSGAQSFKVGDEDWTADSDFGAAGDGTLEPGAPLALARKGAPMKATFDGMARIVVTPAATAGGAPTLLLTDLPPDTPLPPPAPSSITDPVALSLAFDSQDIGDKTPYGAVTAGSGIAFSLSALPGVEQATLVIEKRRLEGDYDVLGYDEVARVPLMRSAAGARERWSGRFRFDAPAVYGYWFEVRIGGRTLVFENNAIPVYWTRERGAGGAGVVAEMPSSSKRIRRYRQTVYAPYSVPSWARDAVYYYIFPERFRNGDPRNDPKPGVDRFHDKTVEFHANWNDKPWRPHSGDGSDDLYSNDFFGGDIAGIIEKLDYIRSVGANTLYITPMFTAASNHKYDTADWKHIDPHFGTNADFERLCREAAKRGIRVLPDASLNHSGADSIYFDRYGTRGGDGAFEGGRINPKSPYASWYTFDPTQADPDKQFKGWVGVSDLPELDKADPSYRAFAYGAPDSVTRSWLERGASGWRMDVAPWVPDDFWREWRRVVKQTKPDALTVAETWFDASKFFLGDEFDSTMNYIFRNAVLDYANGGDARLMVANLEEMRESYPPQSFAALMNLLSTHDTARSLHVFGDVDGQASPGQVALAKQKLKLAVLFQMTYPGAPAIFYGDEVGVTGGDDPMNRGTYPWADRGGHPDTALLADFRRLTKLRHDLPVLRHGTLLAPLHADAHVVVLARRDAQSWAITATNNSDTPRTLAIALPADAPATGWTDALTQAAAHVDTPARTLTLTVPARFGTVLSHLARALNVHARLPPMNWDDGDGRFFNPAPAISTVPLPGGSEVVVVDDVLLDPAGLVTWARGRAFQPPAGFPYPGMVMAAPGGLSARFADFFAQHARTRLRARRTLSHDVRLSMVSTPPDQLDPRQWQCHRDRVSMDPSIVYVASVLYLFREPALGGTSFYVPRQSPSATDRIQIDSQTLPAEQFTARYGLQPGYMDGGNAYFDCVARVPAAWNRMILYDAGFFHSADIGRPDLLTTDPATARLTLNGFFNCRRQAR